MDYLTEKLQHQQLVADRLAAQGPSGISAPHCWFCGKIEAWFACDCPKAREAQKARDRGDHNGYPRWNDATNCIENLDAETIAFNEALGYKVRHPVTPSSANKAAVTPDSVTQPSTVTPVDPEGVTPLRSAAAERMRRKRERDRAKQGTPE